MICRKLKQQIEELQCEIMCLEGQLSDLQDELILEKTWAAGEIDFWQGCCEAAEQKLARKNKPWWRYVIS